MEKIDLSSNSRAIQESYDKIVRGDPSASYAVYTVEHGTLSVGEVGNGPLEEFVENFSDGQVQFGIARVTVPGSDVSKNLLLGWCPDNSPAKQRLSFASNFAEVSKVLSGYHVQITARDQDDLDVDEFLNKVSAAAGARYSIQANKGGASASKPAVSKPFVAKPATKPVPASKPDSFVPKSTGKPIVAAPITPKPKLPTPSKPADDDEEWGGEKEIQERDFSKNPLEDVPSAYKPTKVDINELRKGKSDTISSQPKPFKQEEKEEKEEEKPKPINERIGAFASIGGDDGRLTSLPKHKVNNSVASRYNTNGSSSDKPSFGAKPTFGAKPSFGSPASSNKDKLVGGLSRNFGAEGGKTPAQIWAEKRGQYKSVSPEADVSNLTEKLEKSNVEDEEEKEEKGEPSVIKPASFGAPPKRFVPPAPAPSKQEDEEEEEEEEEEKAPVPSLPARNLPPPPARNVAPVSPSAKDEEEEEEEEKEDAAATPSSLPARNLPPPPVRNVAPAPVKAEPVPEPVAEPEVKKSVIAVAEYDYEKDEDNEIGFAEGDIIIDIEFADEEWWSGKHEKTGEVGLFPAAYVELKKDGESSSTPAAASAPAPAPTPAAAAPAKSGPSAIAEYDYEKDEDNEIEFAEGDEIIEIEFVDEDWWSGKHSKTGEVGLFPANYVSLKE